LKRIGAVGALVALAAATGLVRAQEDGGVRLEYKWKPGEVLRYRMTTAGTMITKMEGLPGGAGSPLAAGGFPMEMDLTLEMHQRIKEVAADGTASVAQQVKSMAMNNKVMGQQMSSKFEGGKFTMLMNGQPMNLPPGQAGNPGEALNRTVEMKISRRGQVHGLEGAAREALSRVFQGAYVGHAFGTGTMGAGMVVLPDAPVKMGQSWEDKQIVRLPAPGMPGGGGGGAPVEVNYRVQNTLTKVEPAAGGAGRLAVIATRAESTMPAMKVTPPNAANPPEGALSMTMRDFKQTVNGTVRFDPDLGIVRDGDYKVGLAVKMEMPFPAAPGAGGAAGAAAAKPMMAMTGDLTMKVALLGDKDGKALVAPAAQ
jgi:hypothetical protein